MTESHETLQGRAKVGLSISSFLQPGRERYFLPRLLASLRETSPEYVPDSFQVALFGDSSELRKGPQKPLSDQAIPEVFESLQSPRMGYVELTRGQPPVVTITLMNVHRMPPLRHDGMILVISRELAASHDGRQGVARVAELIFQLCGGFFGDLGTMLLMKKGPSRSSWLQASDTWEH